MGRKILAVIVGYLVSAVWVLATLSVVWILLGTDFAFQGETNQTTLAWTLTMLVLGFVGAVLAGWVAAAIGKGPQAATWLAVLMLVVALAIAFFYTTVDRHAMTQELLAGRPVSEIPMMEAASVALPPPWYDWVIGFVGAAGALVGGRMRKPKG